MRSSTGCLVVPLREQSWVFDGRRRVGIIPNRKGKSKRVSMPSILRVGKLHGDALTAFEESVVVVRTQSDAGVMSSPPV